MRASEVIFGKQGERVKVLDTAKVVNANCIEVGHDVRIDDFVLFVGSQEAETKIGNHVHIGAHSSIVGGGSLVMGDFSGLSVGVRLMTGSDEFNLGHLTNPTVPHAHRMVDRSGIEIKEHAVIGCGAIILPGVTVPRGAVIGAGSVVTAGTLLNEWGVYAGVPARQIGWRDKSDLIKKRAAMLDGHDPIS